jgi:hypothetical protein
MARSITIDIRISRQLRRNIRPAAILAKPLRVFFTAVTSEFRAKAADRAPEDLGRLKKSHVAKVDPRTMPLWGQVRVDEETGIYVHQGTKPHWAPVKALRGWALRHGIDPFALQRSIAKKGTRPNPWFEEAVDSFALPTARKHIGPLAAAIRREWDT